MLAESRALAAECAQERKDMFVDDLVHLRRCEVLEAGPAQILVRSAALVRAFREDLPFHVDL